MKNILITGGAGFIGSHLADELLAQNYRVRVLDNLDKQVHGPDQKRPGYLNKEVELVTGDIRDSAAVKRALINIDAVFHFAARVGVGQSMYEINQYTDVNNRGTAVLMEALYNHPVERLIVASSMSIYGEGLYKSAGGTIHEKASRSLQQLKNAEWEVRDEMGNALFPVPTPESKRPDLASVYALSKYDQEKLCLMCGKAYNIPAVALRFFNVYGTRQALSNPYTGVLAIFSSRLLNNRPPVIFEDGLQQRDFVHVKDVARACRLALEVPGAAGNVFNIGSGNNYDIKTIAEVVGKTLNRENVHPTISGKYRTGDIRHCFGDIRKASHVLGFQPEVGFSEGLEELAEWLHAQVAIDHVEKAGRELAERGLTV